jgi:TDG/mug DNA glycosylase family protein
VLAYCERPGSLDSAIVDASIRPNPFAEFFADHPFIRQVFFNGAKAEDIYRRHVIKTLPRAFLSPAISYARLPSTSPAHAGLSVTDKGGLWHAALKPALLG